MTDPSQASESPDAIESKSHPLIAAGRNFLLGSVLSGVFVLAYLWLSVDMTYGSWAAVGTGRLIGAIAIFLVCGLLSAFFGQRFVQFLSGIADSANLPF